MKHIKLLAVLFISAITITSCSDDDPVVINEDEVITTMTIELTPNGGGDKVTLQSKDADGDGPTAPVVTGGTLAANTTYNAVITLLNELESPAENITEEVAEEADEHQFFYSQTGLTSTFTYAGANDSNGNPVGINFTIATGSAGTGTYIVTLRHEPNKGASGVKEGDITNAGGETDIQVSFPITVE
ncbi:type 1 periplasmic binding fold superfamily protein [Tenacibaculum singaporense]|uniref:Type 1 periplasmic binding fold superfamily protein n=1 Tax=Tenacibaculum singaporense TaxID=2358479 RepID=A0A3Q8RSS9_9FLAO|nr:type 1 periplasmic binding fold superfamily protein [Tenacibaculum singaporense]AZJ35993.1 type 1 periplasmic binding fold superfamily protein [Tenacibaculum singaporense]RSC92053.1 type 1 periplasmic binding fold superfamily protein [Tenacibaculum singaporense]